MRGRPAASVVASVLASLFVIVFAAACSSEEPPSEAGTPTPGPGERLQNVRSLDSYRYTLTLTVDGHLLDWSEAPPGLADTADEIRVEIEGEWVSPDRDRSRMRFTFGVLHATQETVRIGERVWSSVGGGAWRERAPLADPSSLLGQDVPLSPDALFGPGDDDVLDRLTRDLDERPHRVVQVDGRPARHWTLDEAWFDDYEQDWEAVLAGVPREDLRMQIDIWTDLETGVGTSLVFRGWYDDREGELLLDMRLNGLNDPAIAIDPPEGAIGR